MAPVKALVRRLWGISIALLCIAIAMAWTFRDSFLIRAAIANHPRAAYAFVEYARDINRTGQGGFGVSHVAAILNDPELLRYALRRGAAVDVPSKAGDTALHVAASLGADSVARSLLAAGADPNLVGSLGQTPLMVALQNKHPSTVALLIAGGADCRHHLLPEHPSYLYMAAMSNMPIVFPLLVNCGADLNARSGPGTPLMAAARWGDISAVRWLLQNGADAALLSSDGESALDWAAQACRPEIVRILLAHGAPPRRAAVPAGGSAASRANASDSDCKATARLLRAG